MKNPVQSILDWPKERLESSWLMAMDEVGRGSFFGPVSVGGILFPASELLAPRSQPWQTEVRDSKKLKPSVRKKLADHVKNSYLHHVSHVSVSYINSYNINRAIQYAVYRTARYLIALAPVPPENIGMILLDGNYQFVYPALRMTRPVPPILSIVRGDDLVFHISCASIIAKETRDAMLAAASRRFPAYGLDRNAGYGTAAHRKAISEFGLTPLHRTAYVKKIAIP